MTDRENPNSPHEGSRDWQQAATHSPHQVGSSWTEHSTYRPPVNAMHPVGYGVAPQNSPFYGTQPTGHSGRYGSDGASDYASPGWPGAPAEAPANVVVKRRGPGWGGVIVVSLLVALVTSTLTFSIAGGGSDTVQAGKPAALANGDPAAPVVTSTTTQPDWANVAAAVRSSVVAINVRTSQGGGQGSGIVYDEEARIVTNEHVVAGAVQGGVEVTMADGEVIPASVIGTDRATDLAVLELERRPQNLQPATIGDSGKVVVGDPVAAIGNPLGLSSTLTTGIVSALDRPVMAEDSNNSTAVVTNAIQVDAPVNPGNSGGALFDATGRVIGVTSSIATTSESGGSVGLGFAIPSDLVQRVVPQLIQNGRAEHAYLGVTMRNGVATTGGVTRTGAEIMRVERGTPAAQADLRTGDVIVAMDGKAVSGSEALTGYVRAHSTGDTVTLSHVRDGKATDVEVTLATRPDNL